jgi:hypothetical protein
MLAAPAVAASDVDDSGAERADFASSAGLASRALRGRGGDIRIRVTSAAGVDPVREKSDGPAGITCHRGVTANEEIVSASTPTMPSCHVRKRDAAEARLKT